MVAASCAAVCALLALAAVLQRPTSSSANPPLECPAPRVMCAELAARIETVLRASRPVLLGSRDPKGPSCLMPVKSGEVKDHPPVYLVDLDGGPGTTMPMLYTGDRGKTVKSATQDLGWHQTRLKAYLENELQMNVRPAALAQELANLTRIVADEVRGWSRLPDDVAASGYSRRDTWPSYCLAEIDRAIADGSLVRVRHWSDELACACFALDDVHRWLALVCENHLAALAFQRECADLFAWAESRTATYALNQQISAFPAGVASLNGWGNYSEIERQAERLFSMPAERLVEIQRNPNLVGGSQWVLPGSRGAFVRLRNALSPPNQAVWDAAAATPYEHGYLMSMLYRARSSDALESLAVVLERFDSLHPRASVAELMSVLMYRGHSFGGLEWSDRFHPSLLAEAGQMPAPDEEAFLEACRLVGRHNANPGSFSSTYTLRDALAQGKLDCVRATDMTGAIFRDSGRAGFAHVRWCAGTGGHSVAARFEAASSTPRVVIADALAPDDGPEVWPDCYFQGHAWPPGMESGPPLHAVELYVRGLDTYLWAQGYVVRGPRAGFLTTASIPYLKPFQEASRRRVYSGPFPE